MAYGWPQRANSSRKLWCIKEKKVADKLLLIKKIEKRKINPLKIISWLVFSQIKHPTIYYPLFIIISINLILI